jgi:Transcriptional Coactivator p15 (PC4)
MSHSKSHRVFNAGGSTVTAADGTKLWKLGTNGLKHVSVGEFKGTKNIGLREYYEKDGLRPGKKGINLTVEQFNSLVEHAQVWLTIA